MSYCSFCATAWCGRSRGPCPLCTDSTKSNRSRLDRMNSKKLDWRRSLLFLERNKTWTLDSFLSPPRLLFSLGFFGKEARSCSAACSLALSAACKVGCLACGSCSKPHRLSSFSSPTQLKCSCGPSQSGLGNSCSSTICKLPHFSNPPSCATSRPWDCRWCI